MQNKPITQSTEPAEALLRRFRDFYQNFSLDTITLLNDIYTQDIEFLDPLRHLQGSLGLKNHLRHQARNFTQYRLHYREVVISDPCAFLSWELEYAHRRLNGGKVLTLRGMTHVKFTARVYYHEECYDLATVLHDNVPLLSSLSALLKRRLIA